MNAPSVDPRTLQEDAETVHGEKDEAKAADVVELGKAMANLKARIKKGEEVLKELRKEYDHLRKEVIPTQMDEAGLVSANGKGRFTLPDGSMVYLQGNIHAHVPKAEEEKFFTYLRENGDGELIKETVHWNTLRAWAKERLADGKELPPMVKAHPYLEARIRKG